MYGAAQNIIAQLTAVLKRLQDTATTIPLWGHSLMKMNVRPPNSLITTANYIPLIKNNPRIKSGDYFYKRPWQCLNFLPLPQGHGSLREIFPQVAGLCGSNSTAPYLNGSGFSCGSDEAPAPPTKASGASWTSCIRWRGVSGWTGMASF